MEDALSPKIILDNKKKPRKKLFGQKFQPVVMSLLTAYMQKYFFLVKIVTVGVGYRKSYS